MWMLVQSRLRYFDILGGHFDTTIAAEGDEEVKCRPSVAAIQHCLRYSIAELALSLFTFALFVNSAILIVAGSSLYGNAEAAEADLFGIHKLLSNTITPAAGTTSALALLLSGISAVIGCTMTGQMISKGMLNWTVDPWLRRLITRTISIIPSIIIAGAVGKQGLNAVLAATQVILSVYLPFVAAPLIYFTSRNKYIIVRGVAGSENEEDVPLRNHWAVTALGVVIWLVIAIMNVALLVLVGLGQM
jgi:metal iron transporter